MKMKLVAGSTMSVACFLLIVSSSFAQIVKPPSSPKGILPFVELPVSTVTLTEGKPIIGAPDLSITMAPDHCSQDGTVFLNVYADVSKPQSIAAPDLFAVSESGALRHLYRDLPQGYSTVDVRDFFAGVTHLVTLIYATGKADSDGKRSKTVDYFVSVENRDGGGRTLTQVQTSFVPIKVAILPSRRLLLVGLNEEAMSPVLAVTEDDGTILRYIDIDKADYRNVSGLSAKQTDNTLPPSFASQTRQMRAALNDAMFAPYGEKVLLLQPSLNMPLSILSEDGQEARIRFTPPPGFRTVGILGQDAIASLFVRVRSSQSVEAFGTKGIVQNPEDRLLEVDRYSGRVSKLLDVKGTNVNTIACAANNKFAAVYLRKKGNDPSGPDEPVIATATR